MTLSDDEQIALDWFKGDTLPGCKENENIKPIAIFLHDVCGDTQAEYLKSTVNIYILLNI